VVCVATHPSGAGLRTGEGPLCRGTDPACALLFLTAGALVMETGGAVSHGSIMAREYGPGAVAGAMEATTRHPGGQRMRVDGPTGVVVAREE
jgi:phosphohistidine swiveling domain-containing protein